MRKSDFRRLTAGLAAVAVLLLSTSVVALAASQAQAGGAARGLFGEVLRVEGDTIIVQTSSGEEVSIATTADTNYRAPSSDLGAVAEPEAGDRVAIVVGPDGLTARSVMVLSDRARANAKAIKHLTGIVVEATDGSLLLSTGDGRDIRLAFGLGGVPVEVGESVTVAGTLDEGSGALRVRSAHGVDKLIERLRANIENIEDSVVERGDQVQHVARIRELTEKISAQQIQLLERVQRAHANQTAALDKALKNLQAAERNVERALERVVDLRGKLERESKRFEDGSVRVLPDDIKPSLADIAGALGITEEALIAVLREGRNLAQAAEEHGLTIEDLEARVVALVKTRLDRLADEGEIDRDAVELLLTNIRANLGSLLKRVFNEERVNADLPVSVEDLADALGVEPTRVFAELREGRTPLQIAERTGVTREAFVSKLVETTRRRAEALSRNGTIDADDVREIVERFRENLDSVVDKAQDRRSSDDRRRSDRGSGGDRDSDVGRPSDNLDLSLDRELLARILGLSIDDLVRLLKEGVTLQQIAERQNVDLQQVIDKLLAPIRERLAAAVENGTLERERAAALIDDARARIVETLRSFIRNRSTADVAVRTRNAGRGDTPLYAGIPISAKDVADALGIPVADLQRAMSARGGIQSLLEELGIDAEELVAKLLGALEQRLSSRASASVDGREQVGTVLAEAKRRLLSDLGTKRAVVERRTTVRGTSSGTSTRTAVVPFDLTLIAKVLGLDPERLRNLLAEDLTIAQIAERSNVPLDRIVTALTEAMERQAREAVANGTVTQEEARRRVQAAQTNLRRALLNFRLGEKARERLTDAGRAPDALLTERERQRRAAATDERRRRDAATGERQRRDAATDELSRRSAATNVEAYGAALLELESQVLTLSREEYLRRRAALAERYGVSPLDSTREERAAQLSTYSEELRKLDAARSDVTREEFNRRLRELQDSYGIVASDLTPTQEPDAVLAR